MKTLKFKIEFSPIVENSIRVETHKNVRVIVVNGGGGMGGSKETIYCHLLNPKSEDLGFMIVKEVISGETVQINPRYIGTIRYCNMTELYFEHNNSNFKTKKRSMWYAHPIDVDIDFSSNISLPSVKDSTFVEEIEINHYL